MKRLLLLGAIVTSSMGMLFAQTVIPNGDFEAWQNVGAAEEEPTNWNSNKTGGGFASWGPQTCFRETTNPHSGTYCVRLSNGSFFGTPVNASVTTGQIQAPSTNPVDGYINTVRANGDFSSPFTGRPDSLVFWARFNQAGTDQAKVSVFLHGDYDYEEPDQGGSATYLIGSGSYTFPAASVTAWTRYAIPISYVNGNTPNYILIIGTASDTPGSADAGTDFWIDDMSAVYCSTTGTDVQVACGSYTWIDGNTYTSSNNSATHTIPNAAGCDSVITLDLTILPEATGTDVQVACGSYTWIDGNTYNTSNNTATHTLVGGAANGCDSVVTLDLTINNATAGTDVQTACGSYTWIDGNTYTSSNNTATHTLVGGAANGCDSVVTLDLTINNATAGTDVQFACDSYTWIDGNTYTSSNNTATHTIVGGAANGCDSVVTLNLTLGNANTGTDVVTACGSFTWIDGNTYSTDNNTATHTLTNASGCDSVVTLNLTISSFATGTDVQTACNSFTWIDGNTYTASNNTATHTIVGGSVNGCDSIVTLNLTLGNDNTGTDVQVSCGPFTWIDGNTYTADNNSATHTVTNVSGCDSLVTLDLTVLTPASGTDVQSACGSYTWIDGNTYTSDNNTATHTLIGAAANGCDSVVTLDLTILSPATGTDVQSACGSYTWIDGFTYSADNNTATHTLVGAAANGCDSIVTLDLTILSPASGTDVITACGSYTWIDGNTYSSDNNTAMHTIVAGAANGCDSIVTLDLTISTFATGTDVQSACGSYTWIDGNTYTSDNSSATHTIVGGSIHGCDSIVTLNLTITPLPFVGTTVSGESVSADLTGATYQWLDCDDNNSEIGGETGQSFDPTETGNYAVEVTNNGCVDTSDCVNIMVSGIEDNFLTDLNIYPNPSSGIFNIELSNLANNTRIEVYSLTGKLVKQQAISNANSTIDLSDTDKGVYYLKLIIDGKQRLVKKLIKQ